MLTLRRSCLFIAVECAFMLVPLALFLSQAHAGNTVFDPSGGGAMTRYTTDGVTYDIGGGATRSLWSYPSDNNRNKWTWTSASGWTLSTNQETYVNGWAWTWHEGTGWTWEKTNDKGASSDDAAAKASKQPVVAVSAEARVATDQTQGCFSDSEVWVTGRGQCGADQQALQEQLKFVPEMDIVGKHDVDVFVVLPR